MDKTVRKRSKVSPPRKNPSGKFVGSSQKMILINLYKNTLHENPDIKYKPLIELLSKQTGIGKSTVIKTLAEYKATGDVTSPNRKRSRLSILEKTSDADIIAIRKKVHEFWFRRDIPNMKKILDAVNSDEKLPSFSESSLYRLLKRLEFKFMVRSRNSALIDQAYIVSWRQKYIRKVRKLRSEGRPIYFLGETCIDVGDCRSRRELCMDTSVSCPQNAEQRRLSTGIPATSGKGKRLIVVHVGSSDGFLPEAFLSFEAKKNTGDYHDEINGDTFFEWFSSFSPMLRDGAVIVMDNASYHSVKIDKYPIMSWKKADIITWLKDQGETVQPNLVKVELLELAEKYKKYTHSYDIDEFAKTNGHTVLRLPPYHGQLNPIELAWAKIKTYVRGRNTTYKLSDVRNVVLEALENVSPDSWKNFIAQTKTEEDRLIQLDHITDTMLEENGGGWQSDDPDSDDV